MAHNEHLAASNKQVLEDADVSKPGTYSMPVRVVDPSSALAAGVSATGMKVDLGGATITITSGTVYGSGPVTTGFTNAPAAHAAADAQMAAVSAKKNSVVTMDVALWGTGTAPATTLLSVVEDIATVNTTLWSVPLPGKGVWHFEFPGGFQQPTANKTLDVVFADPGVNNTVSVSGTYFNS